MPDIEFGDILAAAERIKPWAHRTPVLTSQTFNQRTGVQAFFKCENFQRSGAFKFRGAANFLNSIPLSDRPRGVVAYSSGNHAQAVALAAKLLGMPATIVMPTDAPRAKIDATRGYGARVVTYDRATEDREAIGQRLAEATGAMLVPPFDHPWIVAGQGTAALELLQEIPDLDALIVCCGGGGLLSGCAIAAKALNPAIRIFGVEPSEGNDMYLSMHKGERVGIALPQTIADGLQTMKPGAVTFPIVQRHVEDILLVTDDEMRQMMAFYLERMKMLVEPSGTVSAAALLFGKAPAGLQRVGIIVSGGNVDLAVLKTL